MLSSAVAVVSEHGYGQMSVARVTGLAGVSRRTFYDLFADREDCFLAVFEATVERATELVGAACHGKRSWREQVRAGLATMLGFLDEEPGVGRLLIVDALTAGPRVLVRRAQVLEQLSGALHREAVQANPTRVLPPLTGEGVIGALLGVIHSRLLVDEPGSLLELLGALMGMILLPYQGPAAAQRELKRPTPKLEPMLKLPQLQRMPVGSARAEMPMRITYRTLRVLTVIAERPRASNREIADRAGIADQGQTSKLLARLERLGLIHNTRPGQPSGEPNVWQLTPHGRELQQAIDQRSSDSDHNATGTRETH
jgi:AcrR family transcriptional regulator/DNA-binding MarR family transcriptional regulator